MKKICKWAAWVTGGLGALLMLIGVIAALAGGVLFEHMWTTYFYAGGQFVVLGIFLLLCTHCGCGCNCEKKQ